MTNNAAEALDDPDSERPTLIPPATLPPTPLATLTRRSPRSSPSLDTSDVDSTWPFEPPRESFIAGKNRDESGTFRVDTRAHLPPVDVYEDERVLLVLVDLPGIPPQSLVIQLSNVALHVSAVLPDDPRRQSPLPPGKRELVIDIPRGTEAESVDASLRHGVLRVRVDKTGAQTKHVAIQSVVPES